MPLSRSVYRSTTRSIPRSMPSMRSLFAMCMPPMSPLPTRISTSASPPFLLLIITISSSFSQRFSDRSIQSFTIQDIPLLFRRRSSNKSPKPHAFRPILFITLRRFPDSSFDFLLSNWRIIRIPIKRRAIAKCFAESAFFSLFDPSYFLFTGFRSGKCSGGLVPFGVPIQVSVLLPAAHS